MKFLALIPARGGSKGIRSKNIVTLGDKPLIAWTIEAARQSAYDLDIFVSTDDENIALVAAQYGAANGYRRPERLASDTATTVDVVADALQWVAEQGRCYDAVIVLQPTSPLRTVQHIDEAIALFSRSPHQPLVSVCEPAHPPYLIFHEQTDGNWRRLAPVPDSGRRQDAVQHYAQLNGAIYMVSVAQFAQSKRFFDEGNTQFYFMPQQNSVDIDTMQDLYLAQILLEKSTIV